MARPELVATGAVSLILFTLLALLAVMMAYLVDPRGEGTVRLGLWTAILAILETALVTWYMSHALEDRLVLAHKVIISGCLADQRASQSL